MPWWSRSLLRSQRAANVLMREVCAFVVLARAQITSLTFSQDGHTLLSRGMDGTAKIWDLRK